MTEQEFENFISEDIPSALFHVEITDLDDESGASLDQVILVKMLAENPSALARKSIEWFCDYFLIK